MNAALVANWNSVISPEDSVFVIGDFAMGKIDESLPLAKQMNGNKFLIPGNHDRCFPDAPKVKEWTERYQEVGFTVLAEQITMVLGEYRIKLCHFPYEVGAHDERFKDKHSKDEGHWLISGHVHTAWKFMPRNINVSTDLWNYTPVSEIELLEHINANSA